jgi:purine-binding chemotaxis protein CheW
MMPVHLDNSKLLAATFLLGPAVFGVDTAQIQEVVRLGNLTPVHDAPAYVVGIRNLRGRIVTVMDLRTRLELGRVAAGPDNRILIVEAQGEPIGLLVDQVADTIDVLTAEIQPAPPNVSGVQSRHLRGVCRNGARLVALLDLAAVLQTSAEPGQTVGRELLAA